MENSLLETLKKEQEAAVEQLTALEKEKDQCKELYQKAQEKFSKQKTIVDQNARALKAFEPRKTRQKKQA